MSRPLATIAFCAALLATVPAPGFGQGGAVDTAPLPLPRPATGAEAAAPVEGPSDDTLTADPDDRADPNETAGLPEPPDLFPALGPPRRAGHRAAHGVLSRLTDGAAASGAVAYAITDAARIDESLTGAPGDPARGRVLYADARAGCARCHGPPARRAAPPPPAPPLRDAGKRLGAGGIRLWLVAPEVLAPRAEMPAFHALGQRLGPRDAGWGGPALSAREIEDLVAFLTALSAD